MILLIDNYDSFTYNLYQYIDEVLANIANESNPKKLKTPIKVVRNNKISVEEVQKIPELSSIIISPGPCTPLEAGISLEVIRRLHQRVPILGVCLGHQSIAQAFGANIVKSKNPSHGKEALIYHNSKSIFNRLPSPLKVARYHSLEIEKSSLPTELEIIAETKEEEIMAISHKTFKKVIGVQFHPESILTSEGKVLIQNFLN